MKCSYRVVLAGNPNCGKTTIFNHLTGAHQHVGNYSGVTVERKVGSFKIKESVIELIDLPGVYSLSSSSPEEKVAFQELLDDQIDLIVNVIDSGNPQRNLYLTTQLAELHIPMLLVFNMADDAAKRGLSIDYEKFERFFGVRIVPTIGTSGTGLDKMRSAIWEMLEMPEKRYPTEQHFGVKTDEGIALVTAAIEALNLPITQRIPARYFAIKLLEEDDSVCAMQEFASLKPLLDERHELYVKRHGNVPRQTIMADRRYGIIAGACREAITISAERRRQLSDTIDKFVTNRFLGVPIFLLIMYLVFFFTFSCSAPVMSLLEHVFEALSHAVNAAWPAGKAVFFRRLIAEGIIGGVGGVLVFTPNILFLFLAIAFLEGTGYMARAAFVMDGFMHKFGLHGKSFIPMLLGFGCTVPAVMATRTIESTRDRLATIMVLPLMSCGARLPIYALFIPAFFPEKFQTLVLWVIYIIGVAFALLLAGILKHTIFRGGEEVFVMELPPYRMPTLGGLMIHMWERTVMYLHKAGTLILAASVILFVINTFPVKTNFDRNYDAEIAIAESHGNTEAVLELERGKTAELFEYSIAGKIGKGLNYVTAPLGFDWRVSSALIGAFAAKEVFVSQLGILFAEGGDAADNTQPLREKLRKFYTPLQAFAIMLFCLLTFPCIATVAVVRRETNSWKLTLLQLFGLILLAYIVTLIVYQTGLFFHLGTHLL